NVQCKMCGGMVELPEGATVGECPYCGSLTTFPKIDTERVEQLYARAEHFRHAGDFDKAVAAYEAIVRENPDDAEAYWGLVISRFGIEYVEDPATHERIPTCHRVQYDSILSDVDYLAALDKASGAERDVYEAEAKRIAKIQRDILAISSQEKPFDVFICYKETTDGGTRTKDSAIAQDIYYQLTNEGYKVFFSRITLEDKLGQQYEPYIFAALNSAKVMLVVGTKKEYFNAVWVRNEWSRFLQLMKSDRSRLLIPCYKDMDAYDIPDELSMLQSQDMSKIGCMQDLLRGIKKVIDGGKQQRQVNGAVSGFGDSTVEPLMKRIALFLETGDFNQAKEYCNRVLDKAPENSEAYLYQLLAENKLKTEVELCLLDTDLESFRNYHLVMKFAAGPLKERMQAYLKRQRYLNSVKRMESATELSDYLEAAEGFGRLDGYKDSAELKLKCEQSVEAIKQRYIDDYRRMAKDTATAGEWEALASEFRKMQNAFPEMEDMARRCYKSALRIQYINALKLKRQGRYEAAIKAFSDIKGSVIAEEQIQDCIKKKEFRKKLFLYIFSCVYIVGFLWVMSLWLKIMLK
ncbi:MAG: TIR domain-containing protein, partial [Victivallales bacterium]|nr:TIR domain-containing protein [Victivallales bacterium]